jgi:hypothetical protein
LEFDAKLRELALEFIRDHPARVMGYAWHRLRAFWGAYDHPAHRAYWYVVGPLFLFGIALAWKERLNKWRELAIPSLLVLQTMSLVILFASMPRYRVPIEPFVLLFAAFGINAGLTRARALLRRARSGSSSDSQETADG